MYLESRGLAANTINQQLAAVRRLAHEAADPGLLSSELAAGISREKGAKQLGFHLIPLKSCAFSFFNGALLKDPKQRKERPFLG